MVGSSLGSGVGVGSSLGSGVGVGSSVGSGVGDSSGSGVGDSSGTGLGETVTTTAGVLAGEGGFLPGPPFPPSPSRRGGTTVQSRISSAPATPSREVAAADPTPTSFFL